VKKYLQDYSLLAVLAGAVVALDQWTKAIVRNALELGQTWMPWEWLAPYVRIVHWKNTGAAFGMGQNLGIVFTVLAFLVVGLIVFYYPQIPHRDWPLRVALGLQLGGALGNLIDRLSQGFVTDFISVGTFPVFNVADSSISEGVAVLLIGMWIQEKRAKTAQTESESPLEDTETSSGALDFQSE